MVFIKLQEQRIGSESSRSHRDYQQENHQAGSRLGDKQQGPGASSDTSEGEGGSNRYQQKGGR